MNLLTIAVISALLFAQTSSDLQKQIAEAQKKTKELSALVGCTDELKKLCPNNKAFKACMGSSDTRRKLSPACQEFQSCQDELERECPRGGDSKLSENERRREYYTCLRFKKNLITKKCYETYAPPEIMIDDTLICAPEEEKLCPPVPYDKNEKQSLMARKHFLRLSCINKNVDKLSPKCQEIKKKIREGQKFK